MRALVSGGAGFVGAHLCRTLLDRGWEVTAVDNLSTGRAENVADLRDRAGFRLEVSDVTGDARAYGPTPDVVIHLASPAAPDDYARLPLETLWVNSRGTSNLLALALHAGARFVYASTSEVYGDPLVHPQPEDYPGNVDPVGPRSMYDEAKRFGEALVTAYRRERGVPAAIVRIFNTYGPGMRLDDGRAIPTFVCAALSGRPLPIHGTGLQTRSFMYVSDLVDALLLVIEDPEPDGLLVNVGNPEEVTIRHLAAMVITLAGRGRVRAVPGRADDPQQRRPMIGRMEDRYGWRPQVPLLEGLDRTLAWARTADLPPPPPGGRGRPRKPLEDPRTERRRAQFRNAKARSRGRPEEPVPVAPDLRREGGRPVDPDVIRDVRTGQWVRVSLR